MKIKILYFLIICMGILLFAGCEKDKQRESPEHAVDEIIYYYNNGEIHNFWNARFCLSALYLIQNLIDFFIFFDPIGAHNMSKGKGRRPARPFHGCSCFWSQATIIF